MRGMNSQTDRLLQWPDVARIVPYTRQHAGRLEKAGQFPQRVQLGANKVAWWESEILAWAKSRPRGALSNLPQVIASGVTEPRAA
jgi:prophage regulatory protein